jgi:2-methylisocitrate lyase-like PEP mutase family enzyme
MAMPDLPATSVLTELGVKRMSTGNFAHDHIYRQLTNLLNKMKNKETCQPLFT